MGLAHLVSQAGQALVQGLDRVLDAIRGLVALQAFQSLADRGYGLAHLVKGLGLFAGRDIQFSGSLGQDPVILGLAALGGVQPAGNAPQLFFNSAPGFS